MFAKYRLIIISGPNCFVSIFQDQTQNWNKNGVQRIIISTSNSRNALLYFGRRFLCSISQSPPKPKRNKLGVLVVGDPTKSLFQNSTSRFPPIFQLTSFFIDPSLLARSGLLWLQFLYPLRWIISSYIKFDFGKYDWIFCRLTWYFDGKYYYLIGRTLKSEGVLVKTLSLLMMEDLQTHKNVNEHVIDLPRGGAASSSGSHDVNNHDNIEESQSVDMPSNIASVTISQPQSFSSMSRNISNSRRGDNYIQEHRNSLNSGFWISIELGAVLSQIIAAVIVLCLSRHEKPKTPLFEWVICYTIGCIATIPHLYWRYTHRSNQGARRQSTNATSNSSFSQNDNMGNNYHSEAMSSNRQNSMVTNRQVIAFFNFFKMVLDFFFAIWFVIGNIWVFGRRSTPSLAPNLYRLCIVFLTFSCIGYAMPFILCTAICCCLPCLVSILGLREDILQNRGASTELINALPTYKFTTKQTKNREEDHEMNSDGCGEGGGVLAAGTDKERTISGEDAVCSICLAKYIDNDDLRELICKHVFHVECVDKWLKINSICPLCKSGVFEAASFRSG